MKVALFLVGLVGTVLGYSEENHQGQKSYRRYQILSVRPSKSEHVHLLNDLQNEHKLQLDFFQVPSLNRSIDILVPPQHVKRVKKSLSKADLEPRTAVEDMETLIEAERRRMKMMAGRSLWERYYPINEVESWLSNRESQYSGRMKLSVIGTSASGRSIYSAKVAADINGPSKPAIWVECLAHAREWITTSVCLGTIEILTQNYGGSGTWGTQATAMLNKFDWYFVPVLNPDGYEYSFTSNRLWRKNRQSTSIPTCPGIDLNRNWDASHCGAGSSTFPCSDTYCGPSPPMSAPENKALQQAVEGTSNVKAFFSMHSYSQLLLLPHAYANVRPADYAELETIAKNAMAALEQVNGVFFETGHTPAILYSASGGAFDYFKLNGVKYSYVYELRPATANQGGFELPEWNIDPSIRETFASFYSFSEQIPA